MRFNCCWINEEKTGIVFDIAPVVMDFYYGDFLNVYSKELSTGKVFAHTFENIII